MIRCRPLELLCIPCVLSRNRQEGTYRPEPIPACNLSPIQSSESARRFYTVRAVTDVAIGRRPDLAPHLSRTFLGPKLLLVRLRSVRFAIYSRSKQRRRRPCRPCRRIGRAPRSTVVALCALVSAPRDSGSSVPARFFSILRSTLLRLAASLTCILPLGPPIAFLAQLPLALVGLI